MVWKDATKIADSRPDETDAALEQSDWPNFGSSRPDETDAALGQSDWPIVDTSRSDGTDAALGKFGSVASEYLKAPVATPFVENAAILAVVPA